MVLPKLVELLPTYPNGTDLAVVLKDLGLPNDRTTVTRVVGAIRLWDGYDVKKASTWDKKLGRSISHSRLVKKAEI